MPTGKIIKFYREKMGMTQAQLGEGICTTTHVSKIERGKTAYSADIIALFSERLGINIQNEIQSFENLSKELDLWHQAIIMNRKNVMEKLKIELEQSPLVKFAKYKAYYQLLKARYYLINRKEEQVAIILDGVKQNLAELNPFEKNLYCHVLGMYYLYQSSNEYQHKAIHVLKKIDIEVYKNEEYYVHLAIAYNCINNHVMAYHYASKALLYFKSTNNYLAAINAESLMLVQLSMDDYPNYPEIIERYQSLIQDCELIGAFDKKAPLLNNAGHILLNKKEYAKAKKYFQEALSMDSEGTATYLLRLYNYIDCCVEGELSTKKTLMNKISRGLALSKQRNNELYTILFQLLSLKIKDQQSDFYEYVEQVAFPYFSEKKQLLLKDRYGRVLYEYYLASNQLEKTLQVTGHADLK
ncbi:helix-turn-helix domain-containing protein [Metabacillus sp. GX 13764]|uniref:helix-turn-helix domain-containing protein n=1 Tax=Metabacillus kandeliae TaxID=2900151 RepID=UPI001E2AFFD1|nr:helix-turn-helix transcriptional regulator [Metabacillus kandeliae]MCD7033676.1 helix-turn-helix domain-containing protein [Metabacillus kandeliae]